MWKPCLKYLTMLTSVRLALLTIADLQFMFSVIEIPGSRNSHLYRLHQVRFPSIVRQERLLLALIQIPSPNPKQYVRSQGEPTAAQVRIASDAFRLFDNRQLAASEKRFGEAIAAWEKVNRPLDEVASLVKARGNVRVQTDLKKFDGALDDYNLVLRLMEEDGARLPDGTARYSEYPDTFVQRGLAYEGLADWEAAVADYTAAIDLWGGGRGPDTNPYALTFRGNALAFLGRYKQAVEDYEAADNLFTQQRSPDRALDARANRALALYEIGNRHDAVRLMKSVLRRQPGYADLHVAIAADAWGRRDAETAEREWAFACQNTDVGCAKYKSMEWVTGIRRWPPSLSAQLGNFLEKRQ
ncbi:hypothetical protein JKP88DRAFT_245905 [Tribonema minus]|uniref:Tetratricopeptide repeat protein n=1 Tax=Tribonema minus TaxID=303371 RepID=A0A835YV52_9STRA|nr:hypothetical protein JKP88DRAFT_245905 [Tribonema minus]